MPAAVATEHGALQAATGRVKAKLRSFAEHHMRAEVLVTAMLQ